ncbi:MAG: amidohydrolase family protein [Gammaproteobacteria bacterium]|nr:amidohydrolase family protein [Gammaproteobacteria bacterium]
MHDLVIKGARIIDGLGNPEILGDVGVRDGRIAELGKLTQSGAETVEADGRVLCPGVIDTHTHYDAQLTWDSTASPSPALGVTTVVMGNCGFTIAPCPPSERERVAANLSVVEGMDLKALEQGIDWGFESFPEYLDMLRDKGVYPNTAVLAGHSVTRTAVMGKEASERETPTDAELARMQALVKEALDAGAIGFATSFSPNHLGANGVPMPSTIASDDEVRALAGVMKGRAHGVMQIASGSRGTVELLETFTQASGKRLFTTAALTMYNEAAPDKALTLLDQMRVARERGNRIHAQVTCQPLSFDFTPANPYPFYSHDAFADIKASSAQVLRAAYARPEFRAAFKANLAAPQPGVIFYGNWDRIEVAVAALEKNAGLQNRTFAEIARERGQDPVDVFFDLALEEDLQTTVIGRFLNVAEEGVGPILKHESGLVSLSDAGAHLIFMCDAGFACHFLSHWVRERGEFELVEAIRRLTSHPAELYGLPDRGRIELGAHADLLLFDPATIAISKPRRVGDLPGGGMRAIRESSGIHGVWVNGRRVYDERGYVDHGKGPGQVLTRFNPN